MDGGIIKRTRKAALTAEVWKEMTENKSSEVFLPKGRQADEVRRPENSANPFPFAWKWRNLSFEHQISC